MHENDVFPVELHVRAMERGTCAWHTTAAWRAVRSLGNTFPASQTVDSLLLVLINCRQRRTRWGLGPRSAAAASRLPASAPAAQSRHRTAPGAGRCRDSHMLHASLGLLRMGYVEVHGDLRHDCSWQCPGRCPCCREDPWDSRGSRHSSSQGGRSRGADGSTAHSSASAAADAEAAKEQGQQAGEQQRQQQGVDSPRTPLPPGFSRIGRMEVRVLAMIGRRTELHGLLRLGNSSGRDTTTETVPINVELTCSPTESIAPQQTPVRCARWARRCWATAAGARWCCRAAWTAAPSPSSACWRALLSWRAPRSMRSSTPTTTPTW